MKKILNFLLVAILLLPFAVNAETYKINIDYTDKLILNDNGVKLFEEENCLPGDSIYADFVVSNNTKLNSKLYFKELKSSYKKFEQFLTAEFYDDSNNKIGNSVDDIYFIDELAPGEIKNYKLKIIFDNDGINELQMKESEIDVSFVVMTDDDIDTIYPPTGESKLLYYIISISIIVILFLIVIILFKQRKDLKNEKVKENNR